MNNDFTFSIKSICFDETYHPADNTRATTNFANLARGNSRQENLRNALKMIDNRFNALAHWDNPKGDRYSLELEIISNSNSDVRKFEEDYPGGISAIKERMICEGHIQSAEKHVEEIGAVAKNYKREGRGLQFEEKDWTTGDYSDPKDLD